MNKINTSDCAGKPECTECVSRRTKKVFLVPKKENGTEYQVILWPRQRYACGRSKKAQRP